MRLQINIPKHYYHTLCQWAHSQHRPLRNQIEMLIEHSVQEAIQSDAELAKYHAGIVQKELSAMVGMEVPIEGD